MDVTKGYSVALLNIFFQAFFLQQIFFGLNLVSSSQVVGQHEPDVEKKGMSWCSEEMFFLKDLLHLKAESCTQSFAVSFVRLMFWVTHRPFSHMTVSLSNW